MGEKTPLQMLTRPRARPRTRQARRQLRQITLVLGTLLVVYCLIFVWNTPPASPGPAESKRTLPPEVLNNLYLNEEQCRTYFPGLTKEIDDTVAKGPFEVKQTGDLGPLQGRIKDGRVRHLSKHECLLNEG